MTLPIPDAALAQHLIALGKTGSGKSSALRVLVEHALAHDKRVCVIDPKGDWWGLKLSASGKSAGFPVVIFGGEHADVPINEHSGAQIAELVATGNRPCLIDLGGWGVAERTRFFIRYAESLFRLNKSPLYQVIDEVHNFAPQAKVQDPDSGKMLHWANRLASEARGKNIVLLVASQRPQKTHKDFVTSMETLVAMRVIHELDRAAMKNWIDGAPDREKGREVLESLASMPRGEAWVWSPEIGFGPERIKFPLFKTYDSFTPQTEHAAAALHGWAEVDLDEVKTKLAAVVAEQKANDPRELKAEIGRLKAELKKSEARGQKSEVKEVRVEVEVIKPATVDALQTAAALMKSSIEGFHAALKSAGDIIAKLSSIAPRSIMAGATGSGRMLPVRTPPVAAAIHNSRHEARHSIRLDKSGHDVTNSPLPPGEGRRAAAVGGSRGEGGTLPKGERATLIALVQYPNGLERQQLTVLTGYKRSSRDAYIQRLAEKRFCNTAGTRIVATTDGIAALGSDYQPLPTGEALQDYWLARLPEGERKVLEAVMQYYPDGVTREQLDTLTGYQRSSRDAYIQRLKAKELVEIIGRGEVAASDSLFDMEATS